MNKLFSLKSTFVQSLSSYVWAKTSYEEKPEFRNIRYPDQNILVFLDKLDLGIIIQKDKNNWPEEQNYTIEQNNE